MKYIIAGRAGCGRHELGKALSEKGFHVAKSHTTRKPRYEGEDSHIFITSEEAEQIPNGDKIAPVTINGYQYFYLKSDLEKADIVHCNASGIHDIINALDDTVWHFIYMHADDWMERKNRSLRGTGNILAEEVLFDERDKAEDSDFTFLEQYLLHLGKSENEYRAAIPDEITCILQYYTDISGNKPDQYADYISQLRKDRRRLIGIIKESIQLDILNSTEGKVMVFQKTDHETEECAMVPVSIDHFADTLMSSDEGMAMLMKSWLSKSERFTDLDETEPETPK